MKNETVAITGKGKRYIEHCGIVQRLLDAITDRMFVVFGFNYCQRYARFEIQHVVCTADAAFVACSFLSSHNYPAGSQIDLFAHLALSMPASRSNRRGDKFGADVSFAELFFVHAWSLCLREQAMTRAVRRFSLLIAEYTCAAGHGQWAYSWSGYFSPLILAIT
jgi:hypothetical protein